MTPLHQDIHKVGDSFARVLTIPAEFSNGYFLGWSVRCQVRSPSGALLSDCVCTWLDPQAETRRLHLLALDTKHWPANANLMVDVQFKRDADGYVMSTTTASIRSVADVTEPRP